jgi:hypothetical protein
MGPRLARSPSFVIRIIFAQSAFGSVAFDNFRNFGLLLGIL